jgi:metal-sulfur cluster biosynthetic enzyme
MPATLSGEDVEAVLDALATVRDPELDEPVTELDFVQAVDVSPAEGGGARVHVELRLPTYFCAPNFAYLMVADASDACAALPGVDEVSVVLVDHFAADEINAGVSASRGFAGAFPGLADSSDEGLDELRATFTRKAHRASQERVASALLRDGRDVTDLATLTLADAHPGPDLDRPVRRRAELGLRCDAGAALLLHDDGRPVASADLPLQLRLARTTRVSIEGNAALCRGLLGVRYGLGGPPVGAEAG